MKGLCVWFTGLPCSGKTTLANLLAEQLIAGGYTVHVIDGDELRKRVSLDLGYSAFDRHENILRAARMAYEHIRNGDMVICALVSPYVRSRQDAREIVGQRQFLEIYVDTPLDVCEARDVKGMYKRARAGEITDFTGVNDLYEPPKHPWMTTHVDGIEPKSVVKIIGNWIGLRLEGKPGPWQL